jgi:cytoskeleton protein RodZ
MMESIGQILKAQRLARGVALEKVVADLRIHRETLEALEDDRLDDIGYQSYALGFLRSYSKYLGLDSDALVDAAKDLVAPAVKVEEEFIHLDEPTEVSLGVVLTMAFAAIVVVFLVWVSSLAPSGQFDEPAAARDETTIEPADAGLGAQAEAVQSSRGDDASVEQDMVQTEPAQEEQNDQDIEVRALDPLAEGAVVVDDTDIAVAPESLETAAAMAEAKVSISLHVARETWMRISNGDDKVLFSSIVDVGTVYELNEDEIYYIASRDAGAIEIMRNGVVVDTLGRDAEILARRSLDVSRYINRP